jgi:hypothetical protein
VTLLNQGPPAPGTAGPSQAAKRTYNKKRKTSADHLTHDGSLTSTDIKSGKGRRTEEVR